MPRKANKTKTSAPSVESQSDRKKRIIHTPERDGIFCTQIAAGATIGDAAEKAGYAASHLFERRRNEPELASAWAAADELAIQRMEREADRRGVNGWDEPIFHQGKQVGKVKKHSDTLLIFRLKAKRPEVYRERIGVDANVNVTFGLADRLAAARKRVKPK